MASLMGNEGVLCSVIGIARGLYSYCRMCGINLIPDEYGEMSEGSTSAEILSVTDTTDKEEKSRDENSDTDLEIEGGLFSILSSSQTFPLSLIITL